MNWVILLASAVLEAVWATALGESEGLSRLAPSIVFFVALALSMLGLSWAARTIPIGTAYAVWTGTGAALTVGYAMITGAEPVTALRLLFICGIIGAVIGLKLLPAGAPAPAQRPSGTE